MTNDAIAQAARTLRGIAQKPGTLAKEVYKGHLIGAAKTLEAIAEERRNDDRHGMDTPTR